LWWLLLAEVAGVLGSRQSISINIMHFVALGSVKSWPLIVVYCCGPFRAELSSIFDSDLSHYIFTNANVIGSINVLTI